MLIIYTFEIDFAINNVCFFIINLTSKLIVKHVLPTIVHKNMGI